MPNFSLAKRVEERASWRLILISRQSVCVFAFTAGANDTDDDHCKLNAVLRVRETEQTKGAHANGKVGIAIGKQQQ